MHRLCVCACLCARGVIFTGIIHLRRLLFRSFARFHAVKAIKRSYTDRRRTDPTKFSRACCGSFRAKFFFFSLSPRCDEKRWYIIRVYREYNRRSRVQRERRKKSTENILRETVVRGWIRTTVPCAFQKSFLTSNGL